MDDKDKKHSGKEAGDRCDEFRAIPGDMWNMEQRDPFWLFRVYNRGWKTTQLYEDYHKPWNEDPVLKKQPGL